MNYIDSQGRTALLFATFKNDKFITKKLLECATSKVLNSIGKNEDRPTVLLNLIANNENEAIDKILPLLNEKNVNFRVD